MNVFVTGGSGDIGTALVRILSARGDTVVFTYLTHKDQAQELAQETGATCVPYDATKREDVERIVQLIEASAFDGLVHNALSRPKRGSLLSMNVGDFVSYQSEGLMPVFRISQVFAQKAKDEKRAGAIVSVLSSYVLGMPPQKLIEYVTLKYALLGLTRAMAAELTPQNIRVNAVSPSIMRTSYTGDIPERLMEMEEEDASMKRLARPEEVASSIAFLLSDQASYISGANIPITGGGVAC